MKNFKLLNRLFIKAGLFTTILALLLAPTASYAESLNLLLKTGSRGPEVTTLQTFLATDSTIYPQGLVTGYFGALTKSAVIKFQIRNGLKGDGVVGPMTRSVLNAQIGGTSMNGAPNISNVNVTPSINSANISWNTNTLAKGAVYYSASPLTTYEHENSVDVSGNVAMTDTNTNTSQNVLIQGLMPNTTYYYLIYSTGQNGQVSVSWPATFRTAN